MGVLSKVLALNNGIIVEPVHNPDASMGYWEFMFSEHGIFLSLVVIGLVALVLVFFALAATFDSVTLGVLTCVACLAIISVCIFADANFYKFKEGMSEFNYQEIAEELSEHFSVDITEDMVIGSGLVEALMNGDTVSKLSYDTESYRDAETGEWFDTTNYFLVDGSVVEIYIEKTPMSGELVAPK